MEEKMKKKPLFCVLDFETSGLCIDKAMILEIGLSILKPYSLEVRAKAHAIVAYPGIDPALYMDEGAKAMHEKSGLLRSILEAAEEGTSEVNGRDVVYGMEGAEKWLLSKLEAFSGYTLHATGNSVHYDLAICKHLLPKVYEKFSHQMVDLTTIYLLQRTWAEPPRNYSSHRAMEDVERSIGFLHVARSLFFAQPKGEDICQRDRFEAWVLVHGEKSETPDWVWKGGKSGDPRVDHLAERICKIRKEGMQYLQRQLTNHAGRLRQLGYSSDAILADLFCRGEGIYAEASDVRRDRMG